MARSVKVVLYDHRRNPLRATSPPWDAVSRTRRMTGWNPTTASINSLVASNLATLVRRSRDLVRRSPWAADGIDSFVANLVGNGIVPRPRVDEGEDDLRRELMEAWEDFVEECAVFPLGA